MHNFDVIFYQYLNVQLSKLLKAPCQFDVNYKNYWYTMSVIYLPMPITLLMSYKKNDLQNYRTNIYHIW